MPHLTVLSVPIHLSWFLAHPIISLRIRCGWEVVVHFEQDVPSRKLYQDSRHIGRILYTSVQQETVGIRTRHGMAHNPDLHRCQSAADLETCPYSVLPTVPPSFDSILDSVSTIDEVRVSY